MELRVVVRNLAAVVFAAAVAAVPAAWAEDGVAQRSFVLLELFTSQGCYSCPPAEKLLHEDYAQRDDIIALEFHVDYWDDLVYGSAGKWADPFSQAAYTERQQAYNKKLRNTRSVFTPQMIVHGLHQSSGGNAEVINGFIAYEQEQEQASGVSFAFAPQADDSLQVRLDGTIGGAEVLYYAVYQEEATTQIPSGENKGKTLTSSHIVLDLHAVAAKRRTISIPPRQPGQGCAVWLQKSSHWKVIHAAPCPA